MLPCVSSNLVSHMPASRTVSFSHSRRLEHCELFCFFRIPSLRTLGSISAHILTLWPAFLSSPLGVPSLLPPAFTQRNGSKFKLQFTLICIPETSPLRSYPLLWCEYVPQISTSRLQLCSKFLSGSTSPHNSVPSQQDQPALPPDTDTFPTPQTADPPS